MSRWLRLALICGLVPLLLGLATYFAWRRTQAVGYEVAGTFLLVFGGIMFVIGWVALLIHVLSNPASNASQRRRLWISSILAALFLGLQVPLLIVFVSDVASVRRAYVVTVENESGALLETLRIQDERGWSQFEPVRMGTEVRKRWDPAPKGEVRFRFTLEGRDHEGLIDGYPSAGGRTALRIESGGRVLITRGGR
jgi:hypothetical protein